MHATSAPPTHRFTRAELDSRVLDLLGLEYVADPACPLGEDLLPVAAGGAVGETALQIRAEDPLDLARICVMLGRLFASDDDAADFATQLTAVSSRHGGPTVAARHYHLEG